MRKVTLQPATLDCLSHTNLEMCGMCAACRTVDEIDAYYSYWSDMDTDPMAEVNEQNEYCGEMPAIAILVEHMDTVKLIDWRLY